MLILLLFLFYLFGFVLLYLISVMISWCIWLLENMNFFHNVLKALIFVSKAFFFFTFNLLFGLVVLLLWVYYVIYEVYFVRVYEQQVVDDWSEKDFNVI